MKPSVALLDDLAMVVEKFIKKTKKDRKDLYLITKRKQGQPETYYAEFGSLRIGLPRRGGNTTLAFKLLDKYPKSVYVSSSKLGADCARSNYRSNTNYGKRFFNVNMKDIRGSMPFDPEIVITDCLQFSTELAVNRMYKSMDYCHPIYVHLG